MDRTDIQERATELLLEHLDSVQRHSYKRAAWFRVTAPSGNRYRLQYGELVQALDMTDSYGTPRQLCLIANSTYYCPEADRLLALKMLIETDERHMLDIAG